MCDNGLIGGVIGVSFIKDESKRICEVRGESKI